MSLRPIRLLGDPVLREKARPVTQFNDSLAALAADMAEIMHDSNGVGLAAPQVGLLERVIVVKVPPDEDEPGGGQLYTVVNPEIVRASQETVDGLEGCLSIPGYVGEVTRHANVTIKGQDLSGRKIRIKAQAFLGRAFQHEIDHLEGELFIDKLTASDRIWRVEEGTEEQAELQDVTAELVPTELPVALL